MNWNKIFRISLAITFAFFSSAFGVEIEELLLKDIIYFLPNACKKLHNRGIFNVFSPTDYECMFESSSVDDCKKSANILVLLTQMGQKKLVEDVSRIWVKKSRWGPFTQSEILDQLTTLISVNPRKFRKVKTPDSEAVSMVEIDSIYDAFKILLDTGKDLIVPGPMHTHLIAKILNVASQVDKTEKECAKTISEVVWIFLPVDKKKSNNQIKALADVYAVIQSLNALAGDKEISHDAWDLYSSIISSFLNKQFSTDFAVFEDTINKKVYKTIKISSKYAEEKTDSILKVTVTAKEQSKAISKSKIGTENSALIWGAGLVALGVVLLLGIYYALKSRKSEDF